MTFWNQLQLLQCIVGSTQNERRQQSTTTL